MTKLEIVTRERDEALAEVARCEETKIRLREALAAKHPGLTIRQVSELSSKNSRLEAEVARLTRELERVKADFTKLQNVATDIETERDMQSAERERLNGELERVQKREAQMREALEVAYKELRYGDRPLTTCEHGVQNQLCTALATDAGKGYVSREDVKPLVEALDYYTRATRKESSHLPPHRTWQGDDGLTARKALAHAKAKGLA